MLGKALSLSVLNCNGRVGGYMEGGMGEKSGKGRKEAKKKGEVN